MPLQNRVAPDGTLHSVAARGALTGNRGVIHDPDARKLGGRRWTTKSWILCACEWRGRRRSVWGWNRPGGGVGWTELFFLDEVTGLAAGHRPCFFCRRASALAFAEAFSAGNGMAGVKAKEIDAILHRERWQSASVQNQKPGFTRLAGLPDGAMVSAKGVFFAVIDGMAREWRFTGYGQPMPSAAAGRAFALVTPPSVVEALRSGYAPLWHGSAGLAPDRRSG
jgi:hypothetical protein